MMHQLSFIYARERPLFTEDLEICEVPVFLAQLQHMALVIYLQTHETQQEPHQHAMYLEKFGSSLNYSPGLPMYKKYKCLSLNEINKH